MDQRQGRALIYLIIIGGCTDLYSVRRGAGICVGAALDDMPSGVAQAVHSRFVWLLYCVRWNRSNQRERHCKAL